MRRVMTAAMIGAALLLAGCSSLLVFEYHGFGCDGELGGQLAR